MVWGCCGCFVDNYWEYFVKTYLLFKMKKEERPKQRLYCPCDEVYDEEEEINLQNQNP